MVPHAFRALVGSEGRSGLRLGVATCVVIVLLGVTWGAVGTRAGPFVGLVAIGIVGGITIPLAVKWCRAPAKRA
jgi:hypothetical protein